MRSAFSQIILYQSIKDVLLDASDKVLMPELRFYEIADFRPMGREQRRQKHSNNAEELVSPQE